jgi:hypothetical protein
MPATVPRTDRRQHLPRARLGTSRPFTAPQPSELPLFGYKIRHDGQIAARTVKASAYSTARRTIPPCSLIVRHACNSLSPWPIKGRRTPPPQGTIGDKAEQQETTHDTSYTCSPILPQYLQPLHQGLGSHASSPASLVAAPLQAPPVLSNIVPRAHHCWTYGPSAGTRIKLCLRLLSIDH